MKAHKWILAPLLMAVFLGANLSCSSSLMKRAPSSIEIEGALTALSHRVIAFEGVNSKYGSYKGEFEIRDENGKSAVTRIMTYDTFRFEGLAVQEVWTGSAVRDAAGDSTVISYSLKQADFLKTAEGQSRSAENFVHQTPIVQRLSLRQGQVAGVEFFRDAEVFKDTYLDVRPLADKPLWRSRRHRVESRSHESSLWINIAEKLVRLRMFRWFHSQAFSARYADREDYKKRKQYTIHDPTDYEFYQANPGILRVVNKTPDTISLIEDIQRRNAYAPTLEQKMRYFEEDMRAFHLNEYGLFSGAQLDAEGKFVRYLINGDSAEWTGMYLAAEAMRYKVTREQEALDNVKKSLNGLMLLMDISGDTKGFARSIVKFDESVTLGNGLQRGKDHHADKVWLEGGNNDMYKGLIHGFIWAYLTLPESEVELRENLLNHMKRLPKLAVAKKIQNKASAYGLRALATKSGVDRLRFYKNYYQLTVGVKLFNLEGAPHVGGIADWSGINLTMASAVTQILIAEALNSPGTIYETKKDLLYLWKDMIGTKRDFLTIAAYAFAVRDGIDVSVVDEFKDGYSSRELKGLWEQELAQSIWSLREIPIHRSKYDTYYDYSLQPGWCVSWWPRLPWKSLLKREQPEYHYQGVDSYPLFEGPGMGSDMIWKDQAFGYTGGSDKKWKMAGTDYLYTYWAARYAGLIP